ncbi:BA14K family protein [Breoghania sp.]|uniref:BA14K family protein n=1 Tax=Breoghania sp. TaxID=2065378 RepID=UPI0029C9D6FD|nr:BA14K family protein [Breoghania sp.]
MSALKKAATAAVATLAVGSMLAVTTVGADARPRGGRHHHSHHHHHHHKHYNNRNNGLAAGILGLGAGMIIGNVLASPRHVAPPPPPPPAPSYTGSYRPWTPQWRGYCEARYRSFNPATGYFLGYDGQYHFCR